MNNVNDGKRICIGCGVCSGICESIIMETDDMGAYIPKVDISNCSYCGKCIKVCPFSEDVKNEDVIGNLLYSQIEQIKYAPETGYYLSCYEGYTETYRKSSASGGIATLFLEKCIAKNIVDEVICVGSCNEGEKKYKKLYKYVAVNKPFDLVKYSKSAYYPIEISEVLREIRQNDKRVAITVLPCMAKAIRLASQYDKNIRDNIKIIVALTCGGLPKKSMIDYVSMKNNFTSQKIQELKFRVKDDKYLNKNYCMQMTLDDRIVTSRLHKEDFGFAFLNRLFHHLACNCCDDVYGECADISFMDAWLSEYDKDTLGTSIVITRSKLAEDIMKQILSYTETISKVPIDRAIKAQANVGLINRKKVTAYVRTEFYKRLGYKVGSKRKVKLPIKKKAIALMRGYQEYKLNIKSTKLWRQVRSKKINIDKYDKLISKTINKNKNLLRRRYR